MSPVAMEASVVDPFAFEAPEAKPEMRRHVTEIKPRQQHEHHMKLQMMVLDSPSPRTPQPGTEISLSARVKLRESLTTALEMVVSKQLIKSVLGVVKKEFEAQREHPGQGKGLGDAPMMQGAARFKSASKAEELGVQIVATEKYVTEKIDDEKVKAELGGREALSASQREVGTIGKRFNSEVFGAQVSLMSDSPSKKMKTELGQSVFIPKHAVLKGGREGRHGGDDAKGGLQLMDQARKVATDIEAELFKLCGRTTKIYNQKARSLIFNLKDKSNPELRARVFAGVITPAALSRMSAEQLASKELSEWRSAKEQALDKWVVLTDADVDPGKIVKKTHKGEFLVNVQSENMVDISPFSSQSSFPLNWIQRKRQQGKSWSKWTCWVKILFHLRI